MLRVNLGIKIWRRDEAQHTTCEKKKKKKRYVPLRDVTWREHLWCEGCDASTGAAKKAKQKQKKHFYEWFRDVDDALAPDRADCSSTRASCAS